MPPMLCQFNYLLILDWRQIEPAVRGLHEHQHSRIDPVARREAGRGEDAWTLAVGPDGQAGAAPGGIELTRLLLQGLEITPAKTVVELAPGLGATARLTMLSNPAHYIGVERDEAAAQRVARMLRGEQDRCVVGSAVATGLDAESADIVYVEAMLSMQTASECFRTKDCSGPCASSPTCCACRMPGDAFCRCGASFAATRITCAPWR